MKTTITTDSLNDLSGLWQRVRTSYDRSSQWAKKVTGATICSSLVHHAGAVLLLALITWIGLPTSGHAERADVGGKRDLTVMTRNVYVGANFGSITSLDPTDPMYLTKLVEAVTTIYYTMLVQNDFRVRVAGIADEIVANRPDLVGLQEISTVRQQSPGDLIVGGTTPATVVVIDYLQVLLKALADRGAHYTVVSVATNLDAELPMLNVETEWIDDVRLTDHDVILARTDLPPGYLRLRNPAQGNFEANVVIPLIGLEIKHGWCSVDASVRGRTFRFINTHLETDIFPELQWLQAQEILGGPANVSLPVILVGDCNTDGNRQNGTVTYDGLLDAGFKDSWNIVHPLNPGLTWGHDPFLANPSLTFVWRIDLILYRDLNCSPVEANVLDTPLLRSQPPFWSSDHAGVTAKFLLK